LFSLFFLLFLFRSTLPRRGRAAPLDGTLAVQNRVAAAEMLSGARPRPRPAAPTAHAAPRQGRQGSRGEAAPVVAARTGPSPGPRTGRQRHADQLLVVPQVHAAVGKGRVGPEDVPLEPGTGALAARVEQVGPAQLLVAFRAQPGDDQVALLVGEE